MTKLGVFSFEKLAPRRGIKVQIMHFNNGARIQRGRTDCLAMCALGSNLPGMAGGLLAAGQHRA